MLLEIERVADPGRTVNEVASFIEPMARRKDGPPLSNSEFPSTTICRDVALRVPRCLPLDPRLDHVGDVKRRSISLARNIWLLFAFTKKWVA
jgi:hypothetical protein